MSDNSFWDVMDAATTRSLTYDYNTAAYVPTLMQLLKVGHERYRCAELLLKPWLAGIDAPGIHQVLYESITASPIDLRRDFYSNIMLSGTAVQGRFTEISTAPHVC